MDVIPNMILPVSEAIGLGGLAMATWSAHSVPDELLKSVLF